MEMRAGYRQTDVGVIPEEWEEKKLDELFEITSSKRVFQREWKTEGIPFYRARELAILSEKGSVNNELFISKEMYDTYKNSYGVPKVGDVLVTGVGTLGKVYVVSDDHEFYFKDGNIIWFKTSGKVRADFLKQLYLTRLIIKQIENASAGTTVGTYTITSAKKTMIPVPPLAEQEAIAAVLSDADALINSLERLISKKLDIKQGAMQQLLTGKKRLPGFSEEWEEKKLGELFEITSSKRVFQREWKTEGIPFYRARELAILSKKGSVNNELFISKEMYDTYKNSYGVPKVGDVLVTGVGTLGKVYVVSDDHEFYFKDGNIIWFKTSGKVRADFLKQLYLTRLIIKQIENASAGTTVGTYTITSAKKTMIPVPPLSEQTAIAQVLSDMDAEIEELEHKLAKYKLIKQGMMQELLTGKKRLI